MTISRSFLFNLRPRHLETLDSYTARLLHANAETPAHQRHLMRLNAEHHGTEKSWQDVIAERTGRDLKRLLPDNAAAITHMNGDPCQRCAASVGPRYLCTLCSSGQTVEQHRHFDSNVCIKHKRWIGPGTTPRSQVAGGVDLVRAELSFLRLRRQRRIDASLYYQLRRILDPRSIGTGARADAALYPTVVALAKRMTRIDFARRLFDPNQTFADAFRYLQNTLFDVLSEQDDEVLRLLWLYLRPTALRVREVLSGATSTQTHVHEFPFPDGAFHGMRRREGPLEPFAHYLAPTGDQTPTTRTWAEVLMPGMNVRDKNGLIRHRIPTLCTSGHRRDRLPMLVAQAAALGRDDCPYCDNREVLPGFNDIATVNKQAAAEFDEQRNAPLTAGTVLANSNQILHWRCTNGHEYEAKPVRRVQPEEGCPICYGRSITLGKNCLPSAYPQIAEQWDYRKNAAYDINTIRHDSTAMLWWRCPNKHSFRHGVAFLIEGASCHYCTRNQSQRRPLASARPDLLAEWHPTANLPYTPESVTLASKRSIVWICSNQHNFTMAVDRRVAGRNCPHCSNRLVRGVTDVETRFPEISLDWHPYLNNLKEPGDVIADSTAYWWRCTNRHINRQSVPERVESRGCPQCPADERVLA